MLSVFYAECHLCWVSQISPLCWVSLCWVSLCWMSWHPFLGLFLDDFRQVKNGEWNPSLRMIVRLSLETSRILPRGISDRTKRLYNAFTRFFFDKNFQNFFFDGDGINESHFKVWKLDKTIIQKPTLVLKFHSRNVFCHKKLLFYIFRIFMKRSKCSKLISPLSQWMSPLS